MPSKILHIVIAIVVVVVIGVVAVMLLGQGGGNPLTPTPGPIAVADAESIQFTVVDDTGRYNYYARNMGSSDLDLAIEYVDPAAGFSIIFDGAGHKSWSNMTGIWTEGTFTTDWDQWYPLYEGHIDSLAHWTQGNWTSADGKTTISDIKINPDLDPRSFEASTT